MYLYSMTWTKKEILKLNEFEYLRNELVCVPVDLIDQSEEEFAKMKQLEAELIILNKDVVGYSFTKAIGIFTFKEALEKEEYYLQQGKIFTFHPVNLKNHREQQWIY